jgi:hypothetical protein
MIDFKVVKVIAADPVLLNWLLSRKAVSKGKASDYEYLKQQFW